MSSARKNYILSIETSTEACSAAISSEGTTIASKEIDLPKSHASQLAVIVSGLLEECGISARDLSATAVSEGPGSYTGLRVGVSTAKGICYGAGIPLLSVDTLEILAVKALALCKAQHIPVDGDTVIIPMIDARRMEVYTARFDAQCRKMEDTQALVLDEESFRETAEKASSVIFIGDGAEKFKDIAKGDNLHFISTFPTADFMAGPAFEAFRKSEFKDIAYFEPRYLKEFVAGISKKKIL